MTLLVLGGTTEGKQLATNLAEQGIALIYSLAGLVRTPELDCEIVSGGFTQHGGLISFITQRRITAILDATHPYAQGISTRAVEAATACGIPCWRYQRPAWRPGPGDDWREFDTMEALLAALNDKQSVFLTAGQLDQRSLDVLQAYQQQGQRQLLRTAVKPQVPLPPGMHWTQAIGPFDIEDERRLMADHQIDVLVSKNSGGQATAAKLTVARERAIPVYMQARPKLPKPDQEFDDLEKCETYMKKNLNPGTATPRPPM